MSNPTINLIDETNKKIIFSRHGFFPGAVIVGSAVDYLTTVSGLTPFLLIAESVHKKLGDKLGQTANISNENIAILSGEPTLSTFESLKNKMALTNSRDYVLAVGGGSIMDLAKVLGMEMNLPVVAIPTTPATGSEATPYAVITDEIAKKKIVFKSQKLLPSAAILDASFLSFMPKKQLGYSLMDILGHGLEGLVSRRSSQISDVFGLESIRLVLENCALAGEMPYNKNNLENILIAGFFAGLSQGMASVGLAHACAHYVGPNFDIPHSKAVSLFLDPVVEFNMKKTDKYKKLDVLKVTDSTRILSDIKNIKKSFNCIENAISIENFNYEEAVETIKHDVCALTNPVTISSEELLLFLKNIIKTKP